MSVNILNRSLNAYTRIYIFWIAFNRLSEIQLGILDTDRALHILDELFSLVFLIIGSICAPPRRNLR